MGTQLGCGVGLIESGYKPGKKANVEIGEQVGYEADFCGDEDAVTTVLEDFQIFDALFQLEDNDGLHFCVFEHYGELLTTKTYKKSSHSLAAVAHYVVTK